MKDHPLAKWDRPSFRTRLVVRALPLRETPLVEH